MTQRWQLEEQEIPERHTGPLVRPAIGLAEALRCGCACGCQASPVYHDGVCSDCWLRFLRGDDEHELPNQEEPK